MWVLSRCNWDVKKPLITARCLSSSVPVKRGQLGIKVLKKNKLLNAMLYGQHQADSRLYVTLWSFQYTIMVI